MNKGIGKRTLVLLTVLILGIISLFFDKEISQFFYSLHNPFLDFLLGMAVYIQLPGIFVGAIILICAVIFFLKKDKTRWVIRIVSSFIVTSAIAFLLKEIISRPRPYELLALEKPLLDVLGSSFPSAHAAVSFAMLPFFEREYPKLKYLWLIFALLICFIRIYFPVHYLSDILFGAVLGYVVGYIFCNLKLIKKNKEKLKK